MNQAQTTTGANFSAMLGHVADGTLVLMGNGECLTIRPDMRGWHVVDWQGKQISDSNLSAFGVECFIVAREPQ